MRPLIAKNRNIIAASILAGGLVIAPSAVSAAIAGTVTVTGTGTAYCPSGYRVSGGGFTLPSDTFYSSSSSEYKVISSAPGSPTSWRVTASRVSGSYSNTYGWRYTTGSYYARVSAICVK